MTPQNGHFRRNFCLAHITHALPHPCRQNHYQNKSLTIMFLERGAGLLYIEIASTTHRQEKLQNPENNLTVPQKRGTQKGDSYLFLFRSLFGNHFVIYSNVFGLVNFGTLLCPGFAPNPFLCFFFWFWGFSLVCFGRSGLSSPSRRCSLLRCKHACNACITTHGGRWPRQPPPPIGSLSQFVFKSPRFLGQGRSPAACPLLAMCTRSVLVPPLPSAEPQSVARKGKWGGNRTVTQMLWTSVGQMQVVFLVRIAPVSSRKLSRFHLPPGCPIPRRSQRDPGEGQREVHCPIPC